jgi:hypothetical protein
MRLCVSNNTLLLIVHNDLRKLLAHFLRMSTDRKAARSEEELPKCV